MFGGAVLFDTFGYSAAKAVVAVGADTVQFALYIGLYFNEPVFTVVSERLQPAVATGFFVSAP